MMKLSTPSLRLASLLLLLVVVTTTRAASPAASVSTVGDVSVSTTTTPLSQHRRRRLTLDSMSQSLRKMEYAVRGTVVIAADAISDQLRGISPKQQEYDFDRIVYTNIGNPQSVGVTPLSWPRQVLALVDLPDHLGIDHPAASRLFPADAIRRARLIKEQLSGHGTGAYSHSKGCRAFRDQIAAFIRQRDGLSNMGDVDPEAIFLSNGASSAIANLLTALISSHKDEKSGIMLPIPQYPIYSATIDLLGGHKVGYYLHEENDWELNIAELERAHAAAVAQGITVNALVLINPGNPTGSVLSRENLHDIVKFCVQHKLVLLADEVYQENVYDETAHFVSCKRAAYETGLQHELELVSFHSVSKGVFGECGRRGGYMELHNIDPAVQDELYKLASASLCSNVPGQIMTSLMVHGPQPGDESYESHEAEKRTIWESLKRRSRLVTDGLNAIPGFACQPAAGSMYCFPAVELPPGAIRAAEAQGLAPDTLYCVSLLQATGICVVPASGFGQKEGRFGFRSTFLPSEEEMERVVQLIRNHYQAFCQEYAT